MAAFIPVEGGEGAKKGKQKGGHRKGGRNIPKGGRKKGALWERIFNAGVIRLAVGAA